MLHTPKGLAKKCYTPKCYTPGFLKMLHTRILHTGRPGILHTRSLEMLHTRILHTAKNRNLVILTHPVFWKCCTPNLTHPAFGMLHKMSHTGETTAI